MGGGDERRQPAGLAATPAPGAEQRRTAAASAVGGGGLCPGCAHLRLARSARSLFLRCGLADTDPAYPRYPTLPVVRCAGFVAWSEEEG